MDKHIDQLFIEAYTSHEKLLAEFKQTGPTIVSDAAKMLINALSKGGRVYLCGNGGSAADAQHIAGELVGRFRRERKPLPAVALNTDTSIITAVANDYGYDTIFSRQIDGIITDTDILWAISTSGTSKNVMAAVEVAKQAGAKILAFTGKANSPLEKVSDLCLCADGPITARSQEIHQLAYHIICDAVEFHFSAE